MAVQGLHPAPDQTALSEQWRECCVAKSAPAPEHRTAPPPCPTCLLGDRNELLPADHKVRMRVVCCSVLAMPGELRHADGEGCGATAERRSWKRGMPKKPLKLGIRHATIFRATHIDNVRWILGSWSALQEFVRAGSELQKDRE